MDLSLRGLDVAEPNDIFVLYEVLGDSWHRDNNPSGYINLGVAENTLAHDALAKHMHEHIVLGSEHLTAAIEHLSWALANPGEGFLLGQPHFGTSIPDLTPRTRAKVVPVPFGSTDPLSIDAAIQYEKALLAVRSEGIRLSVWCSAIPTTHLVDVARSNSSSTSCDYAKNTAFTLSAMR
ncbi:hypothetical protein NM208_g14421 [Fusarium decemcellulare]|uniref:Uncharacterized protein n=1 Tax=Fusarium decemcellulare TaxID=57161 RepID=A0ACC1RG63_9HYPO|nr:hypothetical protein NM208_g14421 [Fusarium decemcellulare]